MHTQLPLPKETNVAVSPATVVIFAAPGNIKLVALCVNVKAPVNLTILRVPACIVPKPVIVVVPVTSTKLPVAAPISVVVALAMSAPFASFKYELKVKVVPLVGNIPNDAVVQLAAVVPLSKIQVTIVLSPAETVATKLPPLEFTVTAPVESLTK